MTQSEYDQLTDFLAAQGWEQRDPADPVEIAPIIKRFRSDLESFGKETP